MTHQTRKSIPTHSPPEFSSSPNAWQRKKNWDILRAMGGRRRLKSAISSPPMAVMDEEEAKDEEVDKKNSGLSAFFRRVRSLSIEPAEIPILPSQNPTYLTQPRRHFTSAWLENCNFGDRQISSATIPGAMDPQEIKSRANNNDCFFFTDMKKSTDRAPYYVDRMSVRHHHHRDANNAPPPSYEAGTGGRQIDSDDETAIVAAVVVAAQRDENRHTKRRHSDDTSTIESTVDQIGESASRSNSLEENTSRRWYNNANARKSLTIAFTAFYCLCVTIFALVIELSHLLSEEKRRQLHLKDLIFGLYMYGVGIIFFLYCYAVLLLNPRWARALGRFRMLFRRGAKVASGKNEFDIASTTAATAHRKVSHDNPSAGSLYLRLGCVRLSQTWSVSVFGIIGVVYYSFSAFLCISDQLCDNLTSTVDIAGITFIFIQMHFVFCNWKMAITGSHAIARLGTMHVIAANLWTWIRYVLIEESVMTEEIRNIFNAGRNNISGNSPPLSLDEPTGRTPNDVRIISRLSNLAALASTENDDSGSVFEDGSGCLAAECILGSLSEIMYTSIVEYSLIGAAVMFIVWRNIGHVKAPAGYVKRKHQIRVDCSKTTTGLFLGFAYLAATFTAMAVFYGYSISGHNHTAAMVYAVTDVVQYVVAGFGCIYALWRMRLLRYYEHPSQCGHDPNGNSQDLLDKILLTLGLTGELIHSVAGLVGLTGEKSWTPLAFVLLTVHITRLVQVGIQSCLIYIANKLRIHGDDSLRASQPGKQTITFLLIANIAMFLMNLFEAEKAGVSKTVVNFYGKKSWVFLVRSFSPLTIFYRFHSSVCLAEIWKHAYAWKSA